MSSSSRRRVPDGAGRPGGAGHCAYYHGGPAGHHVGARLRPQAETGVERIHAAVIAATGRGHDVYDRDRRQVHLAVTTDHARAYAEIFAATRTPDRRAAVYRVLQPPRPHPADPGAWMTPGRRRHRRHRARSPSPPPKPRSSRPPPQRSNTRPYARRKDGRATGA